MVTRSIALKETERKKNEADEIVLADTLIIRMENCDDKSQESERSKEMKDSENSDKELGSEE